MRIQPVVLHVSTDLGLLPSGVRQLGTVLLGLGLLERLGAASAGRLEAGGFDDQIDPDSGARNVPAVAELARIQADHVGRILDVGGFPVVLGGDDTVLFGSLLALRRRGSAGLVMLDGHTDFFDPHKASGELSDSDLWIATGHPPAMLADLEGLAPLVSERSCVVYGHRDRESQLADVSADVYATPMLVRSLAEIRAVGPAVAARHAEAVLRSEGVDRVWLHLDADCLDDAVMPAVDWRLEGGFDPDEVVELARPLVQSGIVAGMDVTIYNPALDDERHGAGRVLTEVIVSILTS